MSANKSSVPSPTGSTNCKSNSSSKKSAQLDDRTRLKRNAGEKKRRDKLNNYISELSAMVPSCRMPQSQRKLDKSTILKLTVSYMKLHADLLPDTLDESTMSWKPSFMSNEELGQLMLEALDGFLFVIWSTGRTIYVSESITPLLGHLQQELLGKNFLELVHPEDMAMVQERMFPAQTESGYIEEIGTPSPQPVNSPSSTSSDTPSFLRRNFVTRMRRGGFSSKAEYEMVSCSGHLRRWNEVTRNSPVETVEMLPLDGYCLVGVGRLQCNQTIREMTPSVPTLNEWTSYHSPDAKFIHVDQNASAILGYTAAELLGSSGYNFYHDEDLNALARSHVDLTKSGTGDTSLYRFLTKGQQWLWVKTRGLIKYNEGTKQPSAIVCRNIVVSYAEVWQYLQNKARQYGPEERKMITPATPPDGLNTAAAAAPTTKMETTSPGSEVKVEQFSPQSAHYLDPNSHPNFYQTPETPPRKPFGFSPESSAAPAPNPGVAPVAAPYYNPTAPTPNFIAFTTTEYVQPNTQRTTTSNTFNDLFPGYKPSISTEETHGRYRAPARFNPPPTPGCQFQKSENSFNRSYPEDVKPVYIQQTTQQQPQQPGQFLQTISSPPSAPANGLRGVPNRPATSVLLTTVNSAPPPNQVISTPSTFHHPSSTPNVMVTASQTPNVMVTTPANVIVMGQPGYVNNYIGPAAVATHHQVPNVTLRSVPVHTEEPVVGMPVSTGFTEPQQVTSLPVSTTYNQQAPSLLLGNNNNIGMEGMRQQQQQQQQQHQQPQQQQQQHVTSPRKGVSVYSCGSEKRCPSPGNLNSCAQASMKRMRNDGPVSQCIPAYIKPTVQLPTHIPYSNGQYTTTTTPYFSPHTNGYHHQLSSEIKQTGHVIGVPDTHSATVYHSIDTGQHLQKQT